MSRAVIVGYCYILKNQVTRINSNNAVQNVFCAALLLSSINDV